MSRTLGSQQWRSESPIERQILDYFAANPSAQDTLRGIVEWWLLKQSIVNATADVEAVLDKLVAEGKVNAQAGADGLVRYRLHRQGAGQGPGDRPGGHGNNEYE